MSWSVYLQGSPDEVVNKMREQANQYTEQSKAEYDEALPHLIGLVQMNRGAGEQISVSACGHAYHDGGIERYSQCHVTIKPWDPLV